jgi:hypothetical protein
LGPGRSQRCFVNHQKGPIIEESVGNKKETSLPSKGSSAKTGRCCGPYGAATKSPGMVTISCNRYLSHLGMHLKASPKSNADQIWPSSHTQTHPHTHPEDTEANASTKIPLRI